MTSYFTRRIMPLSFIFLLLVSCKENSMGIDDAPLITSTEPYRNSDFGSDENIGVQNTAVVLIRYSDMMETTHLPVEYREAIFDAPNSVNTFLREVSYGKASLSGEVYGWYEIPKEASCNQEELVREIITYTVNDINYSTFNRLIVITPQKKTPCSYPAGRGTINKVLLQTGDTNLTISVQHIIWEGYINLNLQLAAGTISHELMHNFGIWHSNSYDCNSMTISYQPSNCTSLEYGNGFSILGTRKHALHPTAFAKEWIGWLPEEEILTARTNGRYVIYPIEETSEKAKAIRIPLKKELKIASTYGEPSYTAKEYYVEYRQLLGFDEIESTPFSNTSIVNMDGIFVYTWAKRENANPFFGNDEQVLTFLFDMTPESNNIERRQAGLDDFSDAILGLDKTFEDKDNNIKITPLQIRTDGGIEVYVQVN